METDFHYVVVHVDKQFSEGRWGVICTGVVELRHEVVVDVVVASYANCVYAFVEETSYIFLGGFQDGR